MNRPDPPESGRFMQCGDRHSVAPRGGSRDGGGGAFAASFDHRSGDLVVKLPRERVAAAIEAGEGQSFAPAGKVFREWLAITDRDPEHWRERVEEAIRFVAGK